MLRIQLFFMLVSHFIDIPTVALGADNSHNVLRIPWDYDRR